MFWGLASQVQVPDVGFKLFAHLEEAAGFEFPPDCESYDKIVYQPLLPASKCVFFSSFPPNVYELLS